MPVVIGMAVGFCLPFAFWLGCHMLHYAMRVGCAVPAAFGTMGEDKEITLLPETRISFCLWPTSVAANMLLTFLPGSCWALSLHLHIVFPRVELVQGCSLRSDPGIQWQSTGQRRAIGVEALFSPHPLEQAQRQRSLC